MDPSQACIDLVKHSEGCRLTAYQDVAGVWTIGYGHIAGVKEGDTWTQNEADSAIRTDLGAAGRVVSRLVTVSLTQGQFDALTDFVFNLGSGQLAKSTLLKTLNAGQYGQVPNQLVRPNGDTFAGWVFAGGKVQPGLVTRRQREIELWNS